MEIIFLFCFAFRRIDGLDEVPCNVRSFVDEKGKEMTIEEYFRSKYSIQLQYPHSPTVVVKKQRGNTYFPLELVIISPQQKLPAAFAQAEKVP